MHVSSFSSAVRSQLVWVLREINVSLQSFLIRLWKYALRSDEKQPFKNQSLHIKEGTCGERHMRSPKVEFWGGGGFHAVWTRLMLESRAGPAGEKLSWPFLRKLALNFLWSKLENLACRTWNGVRSIKATDIKQMHVNKRTNSYCF